MIARRRFWWITLAALLGVLVTFSLGRWQLSRAAQKIALQTATDELGKLPELDTRALQAMKDPAAALHRHMTLRGTWLAQHTVLLDNRQMNGKPGFYVVTPLQLEGGEQAILVQRGWVQRDFTDRTRLPAIETPAGPVAVSGVLLPLPSKLFELGAAQTAASQAGSGSAGPGSSAIRQNLDGAAFSGEIQRPLMDVSLQQTGAASQGLLREWSAPAIGVERHYGYAFQWFAMSGLIAILHVWFQLIAPYVRARRSR